MHDGNRSKWLGWCGSVAFVWSIRVRVCAIRYILYSHKYRRVELGSYSCILNFSHSHLFFWGFSSFIHAQPPQEFDSHFHGDAQLFRNFIVDLFNRPLLFLGGLSLDLLNAPPLAILAASQQVSAPMGIGNRGVE